MRRFTTICSCIALALLFCCLPASAQVGQYGGFTGIVTDPSGAAVPDATITATDVQRGLKYTQATSGSGYYKLNVPPGTYNVEAAKQGFKNALVNNVSVAVATVQTINLTLQVGSASQEVTVTTQAPLLEASTSEVGASVTPEEFQTLPLAVDDGGRQLQSFIFTSLPGTVGDSFSGSINGGQLFSSEILIDGISVGRYDLTGGSLVEFTPSADAASAFKVQQADYNASYGETGGGIANFDMKSGTNAFHATGWDYLKNDALEANQWSKNALLILPGDPNYPLRDALKHKPVLRENNFGVSVGGPIIKDKTFYLVTYEGDRYTSTSYGNLITLPTPAMRAGDFSAFLTNTQIGTDALGRPIFKGEIFDPTTTRTVNGQVVRDPFPGNIIPQSMWSKASAQILPLWPDTLFGNGVTSRNYPSLSGCCPHLRVDKISTKIDHNVNAQHKLNGFFNYTHRPRLQRFGTTWPFTLGSPLPPNDQPSASNPIDPFKIQKVGGPMVRLGEDWAINDHTLNHIGFGYNRFFNDNGISNSAGWPSKLGITGVADTNFPRVSFSTRYKGLTAPATIGGGGEGYTASESFIVVDNVSYIRGTHNWQFGTEIRRYRYNTESFFGQSGSFNFSNQQTSMPGFSTGTGNPFASFILGAANTASVSFYPAQPGYRVKMGAWYVQDSWKLTPSLTLNYGLRYEIPGAKKEAVDRMSEFDPTVPNPFADGFPGALVFLQKGAGNVSNCNFCVNSSSFQKTYYKEFQPRFGFAYNPTTNLVVRGGYGLSFSPPILNNFGPQTVSGFDYGVGLNPGSKKYQPTLFWTPLQGAPTEAGIPIGVPPVTTPVPFISPGAANYGPPGVTGGSVDFLHGDSRTPYTQNWNFGLQYQLPHNVLVQADYVGSKGTYLPASIFANMYNQVPSRFIGLGDILACDFALALASDPSCVDNNGVADAGAVLASYGVTRLPYPSFENTSPDTSVAQGLRRFPQYNVITDDTPYYGSSTYHSMQLLARNRSVHGLTFIAAYTFSKTLTNTDSALYYPTGGFGSYNFGQDFYNQRLEKSVAAFDLTHVIKLTWIYNLPFGTGQRWLNGNSTVDRLLGGWQLTGIQGYHSGDPLAFQSSAVCTDLFNGPYGSGCPVRPNVVPGVAGSLSTNASSPDSVQGVPWVNGGYAVDVPLSPANFFAMQLGNAPRFTSNIRGPWYQSEDIGLLKNFKVGERFNINFRADAFNIFNRVGLADPHTDVDETYTFTDPKTGQPVTQSAFGRIFDAAHGPRLVQLALRLSF